MRRRKFFQSIFAVGAVVAMPVEPVPVVVKNEDFRYPLYIVKGGMYQAYDPDGDDLGYGSTPTRHFTSPPLAFSPQIQRHIQMHDAEMKRLGLLVPDREWDS